jgi:protein O-mannosyl-transferase
LTRINTNQERSTRTRPSYGPPLPGPLLPGRRGRRTGAVASFEVLPLASRLANAVVAYAQYLAKFFWLARLSPIYPFVRHWTWPPVAGAAALLLLLTGAAWYCRRRFPFLLVGWLWYLGTLVPVIGIVQVGSQAFADRYTYLPLIGIMIATAWLGAEILKPRMNMDEHRFEDKDKKQNELRTSSPHVSSSPFPPFPPVKSPIRVYPCSSVVKSVCVALFSLSLLTALAWRTTQQLPYWRDTSTLFRRVLALYPHNVQATYGLGSDLVDNGQIEAGKRLLEEAIRLEPRYPDALGSLANLLDAQGDYAGAIHFYDAGLKAQPNHAGILNNLAWLRASCTNAAFRDGPEAVRLATRACELTGYNKPLFIGTLAAAQAEAGDFPSAIVTAERAAALATSLKLEDTAAKNRELIEQYRRGFAAHGGPPKGQ